MKNLSFRIDENEILHFHGQGCRPANACELELWRALLSAIDVVEAAEVHISRGGMMNAVRVQEALIAFRKLVPKETT